MSLLFILASVALLFIGINFTVDNKDYLSRNQTTCINGFFILFVFVNHVQSYINIRGRTVKISGLILALLGQMIVVMFLFNSGFGLMEQYKIKGKWYTEKFLTKRVLKIWIHFLLALVLFAAVSFITHSKYTMQQWLLAWTGWESIGNSNWYIFDILVLYILFFCAMKLENKVGTKGMSVLAIWCLTIILWIILLITKGEAENRYWFDTLLAFPFGVTWSFYKDSIDQRMTSKRN